MDLNFIDRIFYALESQLGCCLEEGSKVLIFSHRLSLIALALNRVKVHINREPFDNREEEIHFFKYIKPRFTALSLFYSELHALESKLECESREEKLKAYRKDLKYFGDYFSINASLYHYYQQNEDDQDGYYFLRSHFEPLIAGIEKDGFSTNGDYTFSKFIAFERMQIYVSDKVSELLGVEVHEAEDLHEAGFTVEGKIIHKASMKCIGESLGINLY